ncbi:MAG: hypothetical protein GX301_00410 [Gracilibacteraceae bacterium]|nr:hypothetical protein [Gracilibacteraceae bacterium]
MTEVINELRKWRIEKFREIKQGGIIMMRKLLAVLLTLMITTCGLSFNASADIDPPTTLGAPEHFGASHYIGDYLYFTFSAPEDLRNYIEKRAADDPDNKQTLSINFQVDYKINSGSWHYTSAWDSPKTVPDGLKNLSASFRNGKDYSFSERWGMSGIFREDDALRSFNESGWDYLKENSITLRARFTQSFDGGKTFVISPWSKEFILSANAKADYNKLIDHAPALTSVDLKTKGEKPYFYIKLEKAPGEVQDLHAMSGSVRTEIWMRRAGDKDFKYIHFEWCGREYSEIEAMDYFEDKKQSYEEESYEIKTRYALDLRKYKQSGIDSTTSVDIYGPFSNVISHNMPAWSEASQWATVELKKADDAGLIPGSLKGADMTKPITREEFAELAVKLYENAMGVQTTPASPNPFTDTANSEILKAFKLGVTTGISATEFAPKELTNREQVATMLSRVIRVMAPGADYGTAGAPSFSDHKEIYSWALDHVLFMARLGIIKGTDGKFMPKATTTSQKASGYATTTREMAIAMSVRSFEQMDIIKESKPTPAPQPALETGVPQTSAPINLANLALAKPDKAKVLSIAEKYYNLGLSNATDHEKQYIPAIINWNPDFMGKNQNFAKAIQHTTSSAYLTAFFDLKGIYLPLNAALFTLDTENATIAGNLASAILTYSEDTYKKPLGEALNDSNEARSYADDAAIVYEYAIGTKLAKSMLGISDMSLLLNYGYLCIDIGMLDSAKVVLEAAYNIAPKHRPAIEGMAAYWLAKGDKARAKKLLEDENMSVMVRNMKKMKDNVDEQKVPMVKQGDSNEAAQNKLRTMDNLQTVLASDFYEQLDPAGAQASRNLVNQLQSSIQYTAPNYNYLSQYSTLKNFRAQGGSSAYEAFYEELDALEEKVNSKRMDEVDIDALEQLVEQLESNPDMDPAQIAAMFAQSDFTSKTAPELLILSMEPDNYVNPTDIIAQQFNVLQLKHKWGSYTTYLAIQLGELNEAIRYAGEDIARKMVPLEEKMRAELIELSEEHGKSHGKSYSECNACIIKRHKIHSTYDPQLNNLAETAWTDITNFVSARYTQRIKPNLEAMYVECMKNVLLISDPAVRAKVEENLKTDIEEFILVAFQQVEDAYSINIRAYPYECDCNEAEVAAASRRQQKEIDAAENQRIAMHMKAKQAFEAGEIPENSQLYQNLDKYSANYNLMFTKIKMHPLKTEVSIDVKIPDTDIGVSGKMVENHIRDTTDYNGEITVGVADGKTAGGAISAEASVSLKGEMTVDGKGNVTSADVAGSAQGKVNLVGLEGSATIEASTQRGCKLSGEVAKIQSDFVKIKTPEELDAFRPDKPEQVKKVLWQGEYQIK